MPREIISRTPAKYLHSQFPPPHNLRENEGIWIFLHAEWNDNLFDCSVQPDGYLKWKLNVVGQRRERFSSLKGGVVCGCARERKYEISSQLCSSQPATKQINQDYSSGKLRLILWNYYAICCWYERESLTRMALWDDEWCLLTLNKYFVRDNFCVVSWGSSSKSDEFWNLASVCCCATKPELRQWPWKFISIFVSRVCMWRREEAETTRILEFSHDVIYQYFFSGCSLVARRWRCLFFLPLSSFPSNYRVARFNRKIAFSGIYWQVISHSRAF